MTPPKTRETIRLRALVTQVRESKRELEKALTPEYIATLTDEQRAELAEDLLSLQEAARTTAEAIARAVAQTFASAQTP